MGGLSIRQLFRQLKDGTIAPTYYLVGSEDVLKDDAVREIMDRALEPTEREFNLDQRRASDLDAEGFATLVDTPPLLTTCRVVVVRGVEVWKRKKKLRDVVSRYLEAPAPGTVLILVASADATEEPVYAEHATVVTLDALNEDGVRRWTNHRATGLGLQLTDGAFHHLATACGGNLTSILSELYKIAAALGNGPVVVEDVERYVGVRRGETVEDFLDAVMARSADGGGQLVGPLLQQPATSAVRLVSALGTAFLGVRAVRAAYDRGIRGQDLTEASRDAVRAIRGQKPDWSDVQRWTRWAPQWTERELVRAIARAREADRAIKSSGIIDERGILQSFVLTLGLEKEEAA